MKLQEKVNNISKTSKLSLLKDGRSVDLDEFWTTFIEPFLPPKKAVEGWHKILKKYINEKNAIFSIRKFGSYRDNKTKDRKTLRRGFLNLTNLGINAFFIDNFFTSYFFSMAYDGYVPDYNDFKEMMLSRKFPCGYIVTKTETALAAFHKGKDPRIQYKGYNIAHIHDAGRDFNISNIKTVGDFCKLFFPLGEYDDWKAIKKDKNGPYHYRNLSIKKDDQKLVKQFLVAHFLRTVHPINYFLVPKQFCISFVNDKGETKYEIGEYEPLIKYVRQKIKQRYGAIYNQYLALIKRIDDEQTEQENIIINAVYGLNGFRKNKSKKTTKKIKTSKKSSGSSGIGKIVRETLIPGLNKIPSAEIKKLQTKQYSKNTFDINYPLLSKNRFDSNGRPRYYATPIRINGADWYVCQEWYARSEPKLKVWLALHNIG